MSITQLTAQPKVCEALVQRIQNIGKAWDEHPDWHGRNWYVQVLLAVAGLSRVVEWWEGAERQRWRPQRGMASFRASHFILFYFLIYLLFLGAAA